MDQIPTSAPPPRRLSSAEHTRLALVRAALRLFGEKGFEGTSTRELAAAANANIGSIAYHFGGKDGLHAACAEHIVKTIGALAAQALAPLQSQAASAQSPEDAERTLAHMLETMVGFVVARPEAGEIVPFVLRELAHPTAALDTIYEGVFEPVHRAICGIWATATGDEAESERTRIAVFTMIGQIVYFRIGREAVKRRMGWRDIGSAQATQVADVAKANLHAMIAERRHKR